MKILNKIAVVPDVHGKSFWKEVKEKIDTLDEVVFIGDYLDSYTFKGLLNRDIELNNFLEIINFKKEYPDKVILLLGNHDIGYLLRLGCSRQVHGEMFDIYQNHFEENISLFQMTEYIQLNNKKIFFSHAGILSKWAELISQKLDLDVDSLKSAILDGLFNNLIQKYNEPEYIVFLRWALWLVGPARGGFEGSCGSIVWADSTEWEGEENFFGKDIEQVIGHNRLSANKSLSESVRCVDSVSPEVLFWE
ncbi:MAG: metallophosphoesterase [Candidatus Riflebacteria bacterium]|nr:metallophosphoesterase [Candidatus Riflebacteria bacterium]